MNPVLLLVVGTTFRKQVYFVLACLAVITALPMLAVFSLGQSALSVLSLGSSDSSTDGLYQGPLSTTDTYEWGNCTYWASLQRQQVGKPIPNTWGNANTWATRALLDGYEVDHIPSVTAVMQTSSGKLGHVAYVTSVDNVTGDWTITEMNVKGLDVVDTRTMPATADANFNFIHDKAVNVF